MLFKLKFELFENGLVIVDDDMVDVVVVVVDSGNDDNDVFNDVTVVVVDIGEDDDDGEDCIAGDDTCCDDWDVIGIFRGIIFNVVGFDVCAVIIKLFKLII